MSSRTRRPFGVGDARRLEDFALESSEVVGGWARDAQELQNWASLLERPTHSTFEAWHADPDIHPFILRGNDQLLAYGELWLDRTADEVELARLIVDPQWRNSGVGTEFAQRLTDRARELAVGSAWLRVAPGNEPALACYRNAGFDRVSERVEKELNAKQPRDYAWLSLALR